MENTFLGVFFQPPYTELERASEDFFIRANGSVNVVSYPCTVKPVLSGHLKIDQKKILTTNGCFMKV